MRVFIAVLALFPLAAGAASGTRSGDEAAAIRAVIATWYEELRKGPERRQWRLYAPGAIEGGPGEIETNPRSRAKSPTLSRELAARALQFAYDIDALTVDGRFAKVRVWERGYFYAWALERTTESAASALFVLEQQADGGWLILAHKAEMAGIPPTRKTDPLPDLRALWKQRNGSEAIGPAPPPE